MINNQPSDKTISPAERWNQLRNDFINQILLTLVVWVFVAVPASLSRSFTSGWQTLYTLHIILSVMFLCCYLVRNRISYFVKSTIIIMFYWILTIGSLLTFGLAGSGFALLIIINFIVAAIYSPRTTTIMAIVSLTILVTIGIGIITGNIRPQIDSNDYVVQVSSWVTVWASLGGMIFTVFRSMGVLQQSTRNLLLETQEQQKQIILLANHDQLTGLPLMRLARDRLEVALRHAERNNTKVAVLFIDLDDFKKINDTCGHESGDYVLQQTAQRISRTIRIEDTIARISGDEFLAILGDISEPQAVADIAKKIILVLSQPIFQGDNSMSVGASIGISLFPDDANDLDTLKRLADEAMYKVKKSGKNNIAFINSGKYQTNASTK